MLQEAAVDVAAAAKLGSVSTGGQLLGR